MTIIRGNELWVWQTQEPSGSWGVIAAMMPPLLPAPSPLVTREYGVAVQMKPLAEAHAKATGEPIRLAHFKIIEAD